MFLDDEVTDQLILLQEDVPHCFLVWVCLSEGLEEGRVLLVLQWADFFVKKYLGVLNNNIPDESARFSFLMISFDMPHFKLEGDMPLQLGNYSFYNNNAV